MTEVALTLREKLAGLNKEMGRFEQALAHQEARYQINEEIFDRGTELRIKTLQIQHDTETARCGEVLRLRTTELDQLLHLRTSDLEGSLVDAMHRVASMAEAWETRTWWIARAGWACWPRRSPPSWARPSHGWHSCKWRCRWASMGKIATPDSILLKAGPLTGPEFEVVKQHTHHRRGHAPRRPVAGVDVGRRGGPHPHHERWRRDGYPMRSSGTDIPLSGRIASIADVYDTLMGKRTYKQAWSMAKAVRTRVVVRSSTRRWWTPSIRVMVRREPDLAMQLRP